MGIIQNIKQLYMTITEQTVPANPDAGDQRLYIDSSDHKLTLVNSAGATSKLGGGSGAVVDISFIIDGGGSAITTGIKGDLVIDFACTLTAWTLLADASGAIKIDVWRDVYANFPPTDADSITNGHEPEITASGVSAQDTTLGDWTSVAIASGDVLRFNVDSAATMTRCLLAIKATRT